MLLATMSFSLLVLGWGGHYLVRTKEPNITNNVHKKGHNKYKPEHGKDYESDYYYGSGEYDTDYTDIISPTEMDACQLCDACEKEHGCLNNPNKNNLCCNQLCGWSGQCMQKKLRPSQSLCNKCLVYKYDRTTYEAEKRCVSPVFNFCFAPTSLVETREGMKTIPELRIGDEIRTSSDNLNTEFTEFLGWLDRQKSSPAQMLEIFTSNNSSTVTLSASHVVFTSSTTKYAGDLVPGDILLHWDGVVMEEQEVSEIRTSMVTGFWSPLTRTGTLLVDGYLMSCYASYPHQLSELALLPAKIMPMLLLDDNESQHKDGVRSFVKGLKAFGNLIGARKKENEPPVLSFGENRACDASFVRKIEM